MSVVEIGTRLVQLCNDGKATDAVEELYAPNIVSIEGQGGDAMPARMEGIDAIRGKGAWWFDNHEIHASSAEGPYCGHRDDQFVVRFLMDVTPKATGERTQLDEVGIYTVSNGKVIQEEFLYRMG